jgi:uridine kinase
MEQTAKQQSVPNTLQIFCKNTKNSDNFAFGTTLLQIYEHFQPKLTRKPLCAAINNRLEGLTFRVFGNKQVEFLDCTSAEGRKVYMRSLEFVLYKAVEDLYPGPTLTIEAPVSKGYYFLLDGIETTLDVVQRLRQRMREIIAEGHRFHRLERPTEEVAELFRAHGQKDKAILIESLGKLYCHYYRLCDTYDYYYGPLVPSTDFLDEFDLVRYYNGMLLRIPREEGKIPEIVKQEKMLGAFQDDHQLQKRLGMTTVGHLNVLTQKQLAGAAIKVAEALQEKKVAKIAEQIAERPDVRVILISGPSSSGKTTFSKRLLIQLMTCGLVPRLISLDNYFVDRELTPRDENGDYDYEHIESLNLPLFRQQLRQLLDGEEVELPRYDFPTGKSQPSGERLQLSEGTVLIMEGIHALNPLLTEGIPEEAKFRIYVSALTSIKLDGHNYIPTTINRLIRRIVRDNKYRGTSARQTLERWHSVRLGEERWIFPYQENADVMFNSALIYELAVLRNHALPLLESVPENCDAYLTASLIHSFLHYFQPISDEELPPTSLLREFLGGSSFHY